MSIFDIQKNKAICVLPWVHEHKNLASKKKPCCLADPIGLNRNIDSIRQEMLGGTQPTECSKCYREELHKASSTRIRETIDWLKKFGEPNIYDPIIQYIDIRNDPTCNLKCKTCGPHASTLWAKEKGIYEKGDSKTQYVKLIEEVGELAKDLLKNDKPKIIDAIGNVVDMMIEVSNMNDAVRMAQRLTEKGDTVLLSPACASFDLFENYEERGDMFKEAVRRL